MVYLLKNAIFPCISRLRALALIVVETMVAVKKRVRSPIVGGMFYPEDKAEALAYIRSFGLERGKGGWAQALIAPHGAWDISGPVAAAAFAEAAGRSGLRSPSRVVVMGPLHDRRKHGLFLSNSHSFQTPLGNIPVDGEISWEIESCSPLFEINDIPHLQEHSIEVLLPFVKYCFPRAAIVPILMGQPREAVIAALAFALRTVFEPILEDTLLVIPYNLAAGFGEAETFRKAEYCVNLITGKKTAEFNAAILDRQFNSCGGGLVASLLRSGLVDLMRPRLAPQPILYARGEENTTVCYGAISFG